MKIIKIQGILFVIMSVLLHCETLKHQKYVTFRTFSALILYFRPDWDKCADFVNGGMERWKDLSQDKSTNECVDVLLNEIAAGGGSDAGGAEYFDGKVSI